MGEHTGRRVYYTGDMANCGGFGTVVCHRPANRWGGESVDVLLDDPRFDGDDDRLARGLYLTMFDPSPGRRFWWLEDWQEDQQRRMRAFMDGIEAERRKNA